VAPDGRRASGSCQIAEVEEHSQVPRRSRQRRGRVRARLAGVDAADALQRRNGPVRDPASEGRSRCGDHVRPYRPAETIKESELDDIFAAAEYVAQPFDLPNLGIVIVSAIINEDGDGPIVAWQRSGAGTASHTSQIGVEGGAATLSADFEVREGETAIIAEVFYDFEPFLSELIVEPQTLYRRAHHRPRLGTLEEIGAG
jgi:hypothetical protein